MNINNSREPRKKKAANQTQGREIILARIEAEASTAYLKGLGFYESANGWKSPAGKKLPDGFVVLNKDGVSATIKGNSVSGYKLINLLVLNSMSKGLHLVKIGAFVLKGMFQFHFSHSWKATMKMTLKVVYLLSWRLSKMPVRRLPAVRMWPWTRLEPGRLPPQLNQPRTLILR